MTEGILEAIINAVGGIISALIGIFKKKDGTEPKSGSQVNQTFNVNGSHNTVIGIKNDKTEK